MLFLSGFSCGLRRKAVALLCLTAVSSLYAQNRSEISGQSVAVDEEVTAALLVEISEAEGWNELPDVPQANVAADADRISVLVHFEPQSDRAQRPAARRFAALRGAKIKYEYEVLPNTINIRDLPREALAALKQIPGVKLVEEDYEVSAHHNDSMPLIRALQSQITGAGLSATGAGIRVCVIDTGIDSNAIMYAGRIHTAAGWDFVNNDANPEDDNGHGSHVAGTVVGGTNVTADFACAATGAESIQGVAPQATLIGVKALNSQGSGSASNIIAAINRCASPTLPGGPADVINLSLGGGQFSGTCDTDSMAIAANNAVNAGVVVVSSAGNSNFSNGTGSPACASKVIAVSAIYDDNFPNCDFPSQTTFQFCTARNSSNQCIATCTDSNPVLNQRCCFSNRSSKIDVAAPGCVVFSNNFAVSAGNGILGLCGTSQAAPHVAGLAALLLDMDESLTPAQVRQFIRDGAVDLGAAGFDSSFGWGRVDVINSLQLLQPECITNGDCDDGLFCNGAESCTSGNCVTGTAPNCNDGIACTVDACNESTDTCDHTLSSALCDDGLTCTGVETCHLTLGCVAGTPPNCDDGVSCTQDTCVENNVVAAAGSNVAAVRHVDKFTHVISYDSPAVGNFTAMMWARIDTDRGAPSTFFFIGGSIVDPRYRNSVWLGTGGGPDGRRTWLQALTPGTPIDGADSDVLNLGDWHHLAVTGFAGSGGALTVYLDGVPRQSGNAAVGTYFGELVEIMNASLNDGNDRMIGSFAAWKRFNKQMTQPEIQTEMVSLRASNRANLVQEVHFQDNTDVIDQSGGGNDFVVTGPSLVNDPNGPPIQTDPMHDSCLHTPNHAVCSDGVFCNGSEICDVDTGCEPGTPPSCSDGVSCTSDACDVSSDACVHVSDDDPCDDDVFCNGVESCNGAAGCKPGTDPCPGQTCDEDTDSCIACQEDSECDDGVFCNGFERCQGGFCVDGTPPTCSDGVSCTDDSCIEATDECEHAANDDNCADNFFCNGDEVCDELLGCGPGNDPCPGEVCDENANECVDCLTNADCADLLFCNGVERCVNRVCQAGTPVNCGDNISCTTDSCDEAADTCRHTANNSACNDGLFCNGTETCNVTTGCVAGTSPCTAGCNETTNICMSEEIWMVFTTSTVIPGVGTVQNEDIVSFNINTLTWSLVFDGSDVGLSNFTVDGMARNAAGEILLSLAEPGSISNLVGGPNGTSVDDSDILRFTPTSLGASTAGTMRFHFDGSDVGLSDDAEDVDAITLRSDGRLVVSTLEAFSVNNLSGQDEDLMTFNSSSLGANTSGSWSLYFDGSDVGLSSNSGEDVDAAGLTPTGEILLSTLSAFSVSGASGNDEDVLEFTPTQLGNTTTGTYSLMLDLSALGIDPAENINALEFVSR